jgi:hypothetical protein
MIGPGGRILLNRESPEGPGDPEAVIDKALALSCNGSSAVLAIACGRSFVNNAAVGCDWIGAGMPACTV